jgi:hypothetical protein
MALCFASLCFAETTIPRFFSDAGKDLPSFMVEASNIFGRRSCCELALSHLEIRARFRIKGIEVTLRHSRA